MVYLYYFLKSGQIRSFFWSVVSRIQSEYGKIRTRRNSVFGHFSRSVPIMYKIFKLEGSIYNLRNFQSLYSIRKNIFACLFSVHNTISLSRHEQVCLMRLRFERYFSHHRPMMGEVSLET